jgi:mannosyltransferase
VVLGALITVAAFLRFWRIGQQGFWFDEGHTVLLVHLSLGRMLGELPGSESTPPLYYLLGWVWARIFGFSEAAMRSLSAVSGVLCVPVAFACAQKVFSTRAGLVAAALTACNPLLVWYSQEARSYELLVLMSGLSLLAWLEVLEAPTGRRVALWVLASALALCTHYYALLLVVPCALWLLVRGRRVRAVLLGLGLLTLCAAALVPLALSQNGTGNVSWIHHAGLGRRLSQIAPQFLAGFAWPGGHALVWAAGIAAIVGLAGAVVLPAVAKGRRDAMPMRGVLQQRLGTAVTQATLLRRPGWALAGLTLGGLGLNLLLVAAGYDDLLTRNVLALWPTAALVVAGGLGWLLRERASWLAVAATLVLCGAGVASTVAVDTVHADQRPDWRGVAAILGARPAAGERLIFVQHYRDLLPLSLYLPDLHFLRPVTAVAHVRELDVVSFTSPPSGGFCWWGPACNLWPSRLQAAYPVPGFHEIWVRHFHQFSVVRLLAAHPLAVSMVGLRPYVHTTRLHNDELLLQR